MRLQLPMDADDFRRCCLLLQRVPSLRAELSKVAATSPRWERLVAHWQTLESGLGDSERRSEINTWLWRNATGQARA